jgi:hypothetical protein
MDDRRLRAGLLATGTLIAGAVLLIVSGVAVARSPQLAARPASVVVAAITPPPTIAPPPVNPPGEEPPLPPDPPPDVEPPIVDAAAPAVGTAGHSIIVNRSFSTVPVKATWAATDTAGVAKYEVRLLTYPGPTTKSLSLSSATAKSVNVRLKVGVEYRFSVRATDGFGNRSGWKNGPIVKGIKTEQSSTAVKYRGTWTTTRTTAASGGSYRTSSSSGASASLTFTARRIAIVARKASNYGSFKVYVDGVYITKVTLTSSTAKNHYIVFSRSLPAGTHTIKLVRASGKISLDAFVRITN